MKNILTLLVAFLAMAITLSCSKQTTGGSAIQADTIPGYYVPQEDTLKTENGIRACLDTIFAQVFASDLSVLDNDKKFTSNDFYATESECVKRAIDNNEDVLPGNHWTQNLDSGIYRMRIQSITYTEPEDTATAVVEINTSRNGKIGVVTLKLVWERDFWYIDNFITTDDEEETTTDEKAILKHLMSNAPEAKEDGDKANKKEEASEDEEAKPEESKKAEPKKDEPKKKESAKKDDAKKKEDAKKKDSKKKEDAKKEDAKKKDSDKKEKSKKKKKNKDSED